MEIIKSQKNNSEYKNKMHEFKPMTFVCIIGKIEENVRKFKLEPPINKPSIFLLSKKTNELCLSTDPPYKMLVFS